MNEGTLLFVNFAVYAWLLLLPVAAVEARELRSALALPAGRALGVSATANLFSAFLVTLAVFGTGWILGTLDVVAEPQAGEGDVAALIAMVPCFFLSVWGESAVAKMMLKRLAPERVHAAIVRANMIGYAMLAIVPVVRFVKSALVNGRLIW